MATTPASIGKHPIHPMLVALPIGLLSFSVLCDIIWYSGLGGDAWQTVAVYTLAGGVVTAVIAAIPGIIDFVWLKDPGLRRTARIHMIVNVVALLGFIVALAMRAGEPARTPVPMLVSIASLLLLTIGGWLGGHLVHVRGVGVASLEERGDSPLARHEDQVRQFPTEETSHEQRA
jgi:uncharacterized membrane protein